jgi:hypothetical protein
MEWAQAEASHSRENANVQRLMTTDHEQDHQHQTLEEQALGLLFEAHSALAEGIKQHDDLEKMAMDEREMREVRERSRTETRIDRVSLEPVGLADFRDCSLQGRNPGRARESLLHTANLISPSNGREPRRPTRSLPSRFHLARHHPSGHVDPGLCL